ncbi:hypothetical protein [Natronosalvus amylolyticus]|uniref:hypothetical protein n=1 Tax=Natronosalvus amylolyticus TaxID=2961994 RepID=UPI0020C957E6|nr:hypothetical protein [Natronosalvus amylolyticus]
MITRSEPTARNDTDGESESEVTTESRMGRRSALTLLGIAAIPLAAQSATASSGSGYGADPYGADAYGSQ